MRRDRLIVRWAVPALNHLILVSPAEDKIAKNRMHIDVRAAGEPLWDLAEWKRLIRAKVAELVAADATVREESYPDGFGHVVMRDPEGTELCVA